MKNIIYSIQKIMIIIQTICFIISSQSVSAQTNEAIRTWNFGAEKGYAFVQGEVQPKSGFAFSFYADKPFTNYLSARINLGMGMTQGLDNELSKTWLNHTYWNGVANKNINYNNATTDSIYNNFQSGYMKGNLQAIFTFSQLPIFNNQSKFDGFILGGIGLMRFQTSINALDTAQNIYNFRAIEDLPSETKMQRLANLNSLLDGSYETKTSENPLVTPLFQVGAGVRWKIRENIALALTHRMSFTTTDELDSYKWNSNNELNNVNDIYHYTTIGINFTFKPKPKPVIIPPPPPIIIEKPEVPEVAEVIEVDTVKEEVIEPIKPTVTIENEAVKDIVKKAFDNMEFETGKAIIQERSFSSLNELATLLIEQPNWKLRIIGHTDNVGAAATNLALSQKRAEAIQVYLAQKGIASNRFLVSWYGETQPIATNATPEGRQRNRRVELELVE